MPAYRLPSISTRTAYTPSGGSSLRGSGEVRLIVGTPIVRPRPAPRSTTARRLYGRPRPRSADARSPCATAVRISDDEIGCPSSRTASTTSTAKPSSFARRRTRSRSPVRPRPNPWSYPSTSSCIRYCARSTSRTNCSGASRARAGVNGTSSTRSSPSAVTSSRFSSGSVSRRGAAAGFTTSSGCGSNVTTRLASPRAPARRTISASTAWCPRCTPSNVPTVATVPVMRSPPRPAASASLPRARPPRRDGRPRTAPRFPLPPSPRRPAARTSRRLAPFRPGPGAAAPPPASRDRAGRPRSAAPASLRPRGGTGPRGSAPASRGAHRTPTLPPRPARDRGGTSRRSRWRETRHRAAQSAPARAPRLGPGALPTPRARPGGPAGRRARPPPSPPNRRAAAARRRREIVRARPRRARDRAIARRPTRRPSGRWRRRSRSCAPAGSRPRTTSSSRPRTARGGSRALRRSPAARPQTDRAYPGARPAGDRARGAPDRPRRATWVRPATRSGRRRGREEGTDRRVMSQKARARVHDAGAVRPVHQAVGLPEHALGVAPLVRHHTDRQLGALPQVVVGRFRGRDVEAVVEPVLEALQDVTLLLQRAAPLEMQLPGHHPDHHGSRPLAAIPPVERAGDLLDAIRFDQVADLDVVEVLDADAALEALPHLAHVVLEALEGGDRALVHLHAVADHPHPRRPGDDPGAHEAPRDGTDLGDLKRLSHLGLPQHDFLLLGREQSLHCSLHLFHRLVDDAVGADLHALALGRGACVGIGSHVEADDDGTRRLREQDIRVGDGADAAVHDFHLDFRGGQLGQRVRERFRGAALVRLDDDAQRRGAPGRALRHEVLERLHASAAAVLRLALQALALLGDLARRPGIRHHTEGVPRLGHALEAEDLHGRRGTGDRHRLAALVVHGAHAPGELAADEVVPHPERAVLHQDRRHRPLARAAGRLEHSAVGPAGGIRVHLEALGLHA